MHDATPPVRLRSASDLHNALFDAMTDGVIMVNTQGVIIDCNPIFHTRLGYTKDEVVGMPLSVIDPPEFAAQVPERLRQIRRDGQATFETAHYYKDGRVMPVELNARYVDVGDETIFFSIVRDITERKKLEANLKDGLEMYQAAINTPVMGFWAVDARGALLDANDAYAALSGYSRSELVQLTIPQLEAIERPEETAQRIRQIIDAGYARFRSMHRRKDGSVWPVEVVTTYSPIQGGRFFAFLEDLSEKVEYERRLEIAATVFDSMEQAVVVTDAENRIVSINPAAARITGYSLDEVRGKNPRVFASGRHDKVFYEEMWRTLLNAGRWEGEIWDRRQDGEIYLKWLAINAIRDATGRIHQYVSVFSDITERKRNEELIWKQANFDALTELPNRHLMHERLEQEMKKSLRAGYRLAVLFIDLDRFKEVNDTFGHAKGDLLLVSAARRIVARLRDTDTVARLGGDEFTVILPDFGSFAVLERLAQSLINDLSEPYELGDGEYGYVSASIGVTVYPDDAPDIDGLLKHADQAMYVAKSEGRNRFSYFTSSMQDESRDKQLLIGDLRQALRRGQLEVYYQPILELRSGRIVKAEALLRWKHPQRGMISPVVFIPLAEDTGLIHDIGDWVSQQALDGVLLCRERHGRDIQISINKSPIQFERSGKGAWMERLTALGLPSNCIIVEITESSLLSKSPRIKQQLTDYFNAGIEVSIDDFGTGFSSLSYLHQFDIDYLKIDRSFVSGLGVNDAQTALCEAIIVMAHKLGIRTIAEGVETEAQRDMLDRFGCDFVQGFLYAPALPFAEFEQLLSENGKPVQ
ncbi:MAG: EAL domain-containing protein [Pseudomonadota bacterium]